MNRHVSNTAASLLLLICLGMFAPHTSTVSAQTAAAGRTPVAGECDVTPKPEDAKKTTVAADDLGGIRLDASVGDKKLARKRFYLLEKNVRQAGLGIDWNTVPVRAEFFKDASPGLREWLARHDCDSLYCPEYEAEYETAKATVPEFRQAYEAGIKKYKDPKLALKWISVNFPLKQARLGYYEKKRDWVERAAKSAGTVLSVMTDEKGIAYFTKIKPGTYYISNVLPLEQGNILWSCEVVVPPLVPGRLHSVSVKFSAPKTPAAAPPATSAASANR